MTSQRTVTLIDADFIRHTLVCSDEPYQLRTNAGIHGLTPIAISTKTVAGVPGEIISDVRKLPRQILVPVIVEGATEQEVDQFLGNLGRALHDECRISFERPDGSIREIEARYTSGAEAVRVEDYETRSVTVPLVFTAHEPFWRSVTSPVKFEGEILDNGLSAGANDIYMNNEGDESVYPVWRVSGPTQGIEILNARTGQLFRMTEILDTNADLIEIRTDPRFETGAWLNGGAHFWPFDEFSEFIELLPGQNLIIARGIDPTNAGLAGFSATWSELFDSC